MYKCISEYSSSQKGHPEEFNTQYTIMALGRGEYPKLSTPLGLFPREEYIKKLFPPVKCGLPL